MARPPSFAPTRLVLLGAAAVAISLGVACSSKPEEVETRTDDSSTPKPVEAAVDPASLPDVVATVNGVAIEKATLLALASGRGGQGSSEVRTLDFYREVLNELIGAELLFQASKDRNLMAGAEEVNQQIDALRGRFPDSARFEEALASEGLTLEKLRDQLQRNMTIQKLIEADIAPKVQVTEDASRKYYDENTEQMRQPDRLRVRHILKRVAPDSPPESRRAARTALEEIREQASSGSDFAALAREHSEDPGSAADGGEMVIAPGETVPPFEEAAFALEPGGLSPVIETQFGYHVIQLREKIAGQVVPYEQVQPRIQEFLKQRGVKEQIDNTLEGMKKGAEVEVLI